MDGKREGLGGRGGREEGRVRGQGGREEPSPADQL